MARFFSLLETPGGEGRAACVVGSGEVVVGAELAFSVQAPESAGVIAAVLLGGPPQRQVVRAVLCTVLDQATSLPLTGRRGSDALVGLSLEDLVREMRNGDVWLVVHTLNGALRGSVREALPATALPSDTREGEFRVNRTAGLRLTSEGSRATGSRAQEASAKEGG